MKDYRWNIVGHQKQLSELETDLKGGNMAHAYLFAGVSGIGKFTVAKALAKILQCEATTGEASTSVPCLICPTCIQLEKGYQPDTIEVTDDGESIKIEHIRTIVNRLYTTTQSRFKILLLQNIERCTPESANALLKIIEDPPPHVVFLFTTSRLEALLKTVISRLRLYKFHHLTQAELMRFLALRSPILSAEEQTLIAQVAFGRPGMALQFSENKELFEQYQSLYNRIGEFMKKPDLVESFTYTAERAKNEGAPEAFLDVMLTQLQKKLHAEVQDDRPAPELVKTIQLVKRVQLGYEMLGRNVNNRLLFENLMLSL